MAKIGTAPIGCWRPSVGSTSSSSHCPSPRNAAVSAGTFSLKNPDVSIAMASDKARHVRSTNCEYLVAADNACLLNIGGILHRQFSGVKTIHLAEILAHTEGDVA